MAMKQTHYYQSLCSHLHKVTENTKLKHNGWQIVSLPLATVTPSNQLINIVQL